MSATNDAFIAVPCKCPICDRESRHLYIKSKLYSPLQTEDDQHVVSYKWESPKYEGIRPNFYHVWHCPECHFCDEKEVFRGEDNSGGKLELIREKLLIQAKAPNSFIVLLGKVISLDRDYVSLEAALCAHLEAIYIQEMLSPNMRQYLKLGRLYLRVAWLYREKKTWNMPETDVPTGYPAYGDFFAALRGEWPDLPLTEEAALDKAIFNYQCDLDRSKRVDDARYEIGVTFLLADLHLRLDRPDEALKCVRGAFQAATRKRQAMRQALDGAISRGKGTAQQIEQMRSLITWLNNAIDRATTLGEKVNDVIFQHEYPAAREAVLTLQAPTPELVLQRLHESNFHEITCRRVAALFAKRVLVDKLEDAKTAEAEQQAKAEERQRSGFWGNLLNKFKGGEGDGGQE